MKKYPWQNYFFDYLNNNKRRKSFCPPFDIKRLTWRIFHYTETDTKVRQRKKEILFIIYHHLCLCTELTTLESWADPYHFNSCPRINYVRNKFQMICDRQNEYSLEIIGFGFLCCFGCDTCEEKGWSHYKLTWLCLLFVTRVAWHMSSLR